MAIYSKNGTPLNAVYGKSGNPLDTAYDADGNLIYRKGVDYTKYSYTEKWGSKGIAHTQGFDILDGKVFWVSKSGDSTVPADCYVWDFGTGAQALSTPYVTVYSGHGNNVAFADGKVYFAPAYTPSRVYENTFTSDFVFTLGKTLLLNDGTTACDACLDENDPNILWSIGHTGSVSSGLPDKISKWDLNSLTDNGDGTFSPLLLQSVDTPMPSQYYLQGSRMHDGILWYTSGYAGTSTEAYIYGVNPNTGEVLYSIDCETTAEPEGLVWYPDESADGGYALYVGFQYMKLRKYVFYY